MAVYVLAAGGLLGVWFGVGLRCARSDWMVLPEALPVQLAW